jgi:DNA-binding MarR family transcriptional regulator
MEPVLSSSMSVDPKLVNRLGALATLLQDAVDEVAATVATGVPVDAEALACLVNFADGRRIDDLRRALALSQPGAAHLVSRLEAAGLAERSRDPDDGRGILVSLTDRGAAEAARITAARDAALRDALGPVSKSDQRAVLGFVDGVLRRGTTGRESARRHCRLCDGDACGHPDDCPITLRADEIEAAQT